MLSLLVSPLFAGRSQGRVSTHRSVQFSGATSLAERRLPDLNALRSRFAPDPARLPDVCVRLASLSDYEALVNLDEEMPA
jgi:hypothetical protein